MRIGPRIYLIVALIIVASLVTYGIARSGMQQIRATYDTAFKERAPITRIVDDFKSTSLDMKLQVWTLLVPDMPKSFTEQQIKDMDGLKQHITELVTDWDENAAKAATPAENAKFKELADATVPWFAAIDEYDAHMMKWLKTGDPAERMAAFKSNDTSGAVDGTQVTIEDLTAQMIEITTAESQKVQAEAEAEQAAALQTLLLVAVGTALASILAGVLIASSITRPIGSTVRFAEAVADGDLSAKVPVHVAGEMGELTRAIERMKESLVSRMDQMREVAAMVELAAQGVSVTAADVSDAAMRSGDAELTERAETLVRQSGNLRSALAGLTGAEPAKKEDAA